MPGSAYHVNGQVCHRFCATKSGDFLYIQI
jgi:hypothetical protein